MTTATAIAPTSFGWSVAHGVATLLLDRPERKNALTFGVYEELRSTFRALADAPEIRAIVLTGRGTDFCSGGDVHEIIGPLLRMSADEQLEFTRMSCDVVRAMRHCPQPIVAAVDGAAAGAGAVLAAASDIRIGTPRASVAFLFARVGLAGSDMGACALLPRIVGLGRAAELLYTGRAMTGEEAERWGFFTRLVPPERLQDEAHTLARAIAAGPAVAHATTKRMLHAEHDMSLDAALDAEAEAQAACMRTRDFARAYEAFVAKRAPEFRGD